MSLLRMVSRRTALKSRMSICHPALISLSLAAFPFPPLQRQLQVNDFHQQQRRGIIIIITRVHILEELLFD